MAFPDKAELLLDAALSGGIGRWRWLPTVKKRICDGFPALQGAGWLPVRAAKFMNRLVLDF